MKSIFEDKTNEEFWAEFSAAPQSKAPEDNLSYVVRAFRNSETFSIDDMVTEYMNGEELVGTLIQVQEHVAELREQIKCLDDTIFDLENDID